VKKILFICTGNTCRSSMAEAFFNSVIKEDCKLAGRFSASSAGIAAINGMPASENSIYVMKEHWGIHLDLHRSRSVTVEDIDNAFLILTMTRHHKDALIRAFPHYRSKIHTLKEYVTEGKGTDITDPFGMSEDVYRKCAAEIKAAVDMLAEKFRE
jgi:protein-tyrosine phosphatase